MSTGSSPPPLLRLEDVSKTFTRRGQTDVEALRGITLDVRRGEFLAVVGASGSGKSTLLRIIDGLLPASSGRVLVDGHPVTRPGRNRAMVFQQDSLLPWRDVLGNIAYGLHVAGMRRAAAREKAEHFVALVGLRGFERHYPHQLSGGMRQRVNLARALAVRPDILLLDEPFAALDAQTREVMQSELLRIWGESGATVVLITHQIDEAVLLSDRIAVFSARPGRLRQVVEVDLARPRDLSDKRQPRFLALVDAVWGMIEHEVRQAVAAGQA